MLLIDRALAIVPVAVSKTSSAKQLLLLGFGEMHKFIKAPLALLPTRSIVGHHLAIMLEGIPQIRVERATHVAKNMLYLRGMV